VYDYPYMRVDGGKVAETIGEIDRYAFRINGTTRFYMALGGH
jgi:hypothetical protein